MNTTGAFGPEKRDESGVPVGVTITDESYRDSLYFDQWALMRAQRQGGAWSNRSLFSPFVPVRATHRLSDLPAEYRDSRGGGYGKTFISPLIASILAQRIGDPGSAKALATKLVMPEALAEKIRNLPLGRFATRYASLEQPGINERIQGVDLAMKAAEPLSGEQVVASAQVAIAQYDLAGQLEELGHPVRPISS